MHIFIDESGLFSVSSKSQAWSTVGGVVIPDGSLEKVGESLAKLKAEYGLGIDEEFKRNRPDCASEPYQEFLKSLDKAGCTLHAVSTVSDSASGVEDLEKHRDSTIAAIRNYSSSKERDLELYAEEVVALVRSLSRQEFNQCILQVQMICEMLPKIISHYAGILPEELGRFKWVIDKKNINKENKYEKCFKDIYIGMIMVGSANQNSAIITGRNYEAFNRAFSPKVNTGELLRSFSKETGIDRSHLKNSIVPVSFSKLLENEFSLEDSKRSIGLQVADLLISSVNRCLKQNYTNNKKMAKALGRLMINSPRVDGWSLTVRACGNPRSIKNAPANLIKLMDASSKHLYSKKLKENYSKALSLI
ncbi:hypothetical protein DJFAAGMI_04173 [Comamonas sp. PE63]|uniref:DUF3800 domain-containing protein n=1 Tax=Comamonas brasiliensis TaxID=1812482 RepID=A0ABS5LYQ9_9BURK|nr:DUF3800 domain-containing protein [Comamonas sp. PE63]MBS3021401.1 hypothetical protein [Comamonas sp. PE63]